MRSPSAIMPLGWVSPLMCRASSWRENPDVGFASRIRRAITSLFRKSVSGEFTTMGFAPRSIGMDGLIVDVDCPFIDAGIAGVARLITEFKRSCPAVIEIIRAIGSVSVRVVWAIVGSENPGLGLKALSGPRFERLLCFTNQRGQRLNDRSVPQKACALSGPKMNEIGSPLGKSRGAKGGLQPGFELDRAQTPGRGVKEGGLSSFAHEASADLDFGSISKMTSTTRGAPTGRLCTP